ncbi:4-(cytidine 5'-diphospho)-2-C-methyl-D-erythritol kinase [Clostridium intestinale]|uniref:4-diphosphocytidyl-2-C-methyl-D-erythritol kinase n=2 Tax=Clostridium intestinale TaxID=36845 RepID=U2NSL9_9CLOT|nr:4-(cytidine 5'-diphospho)-2-C-methyl-D-erythritol kinase [Clostridium intestinale]ERK32173.1 4-diphosphocytidyl-2-C-methyl-D-erythritol kinase [Clostridium intestinale URNW]QLY79252.1 4-(cytidine 5'-diphospho)-2-C-methyl-D-erythritol kinase [Clostridium intestinale]
MKIKAYGKINIALEVVGKREDGYHLLRMIMQNIDLYDLIELNEKRSNDITIECNKPYVPKDDRNLAYKAARLFMDTYKINRGIHIDIIKNIPVAAGLAGGSTNAAAVLKALNEMFDVGASEQELMNLGVKLGADIPYCIKGGTCLCEGIGEKISELKSFKDKILVLVKPPFGVSTKDVYGAIDINKIFKKVLVNELIEAIEKDDLLFVAQNMKNHLENVTLRRHPLIIKIKEDMIKMGSIGSMMSGSGPTVFGFFDDMLKAQSCYERMKKQFNDVFITRTI